MTCAFIDAYRDRFGVVPICRVLSQHGVPIALRTYWARRSRPPSRRALRDAALTGILAGICQPGEHGRRPPECLYGSLKMHAHLRRLGITAARCTVERLIRANGWRGVTRARTVRTTVRDAAHDRAPDLVNRDFTATAPGQLVVADFTCVPLHGGGFACTAFCTGAYAGLIAGRECSLSKETAFAQKAISQAAALRARHGPPAGGRAIHHCDAGSQYTSVRFAETLMLAGLAASIGSVGDACDNALAETTIGLYKTECTRDGSPFRTGPVTTLAALEQATSTWVHWYNHHRLMHRLGRKPPPKPKPSTTSAPPAARAVRLDMGHSRRAASRPAGSKIQGRSRPRLPRPM